MKRWDLMSLPPSSEKRSPREAGSDAPRVPSSDGRMPRVLFSSPECRAVILDLESGESMGYHQVRERSVVQVVTGRVSIESSGEAVECDAGTLIIFEPGERRTLRGLAITRLLLVLTPWPAARHSTDTQTEFVQQHLPANAVVDPIPSTIGA